MLLGSLFFLSHRGQANLFAQEPTVEKREDHRANLPVYFPQWEVVDHEMGNDQNPGLVVFLLPSYMGVSKKSANPKS